MVIAIDLGSNTLRVALIKQVKFAKNSGFENIKVFERIVGSAKDLNRTGIIGKEAVERIFKALEAAKQEFDFDCIPHFAVATQAFRKARNSGEIFARILQKFGINFTIISAQAEARMTAIGVQNALLKLGIKMAKTAFIDLGGASTEISDGVKFSSFEFGIITFYESLKFNDEKFRFFEVARDSAKLAVFEARAFLLNLNADRVVLTSGVPTTMAAMKLNMRYFNYDAARINGVRLKFDDFYEMAQSLLKIKTKAADELVGVGRAMPIVAGMSLLETLLKGYKGEMIVVDDGLREGVGATYLSGKLDEILKI